MNTGTSTNPTNPTNPMASDLVSAPKKTASFLSGLFQDLKERFLKFGAIRGLIMIPLGTVGVIVVLTNFKYILHALAALVFVAAIVEGLYQLLHNPVKKQMALDDLVTLRTDAEDFLEHLSRLATKKFGFPVLFTPINMPLSTGSTSSPASVNPTSTPSTPQSPAPTISPSAISVDQVPQAMTGVTNSASTDTSTPAP